MEQRPREKGHVASTQQNDPSKDCNLCALVLSTVLLWVTMPLVSLTSKCLLTSKRCSRWGPNHGADLGAPLTSASLHLTVVGGSLMAYILLHRIWIALRHGESEERDRTIRQRVLEQGDFLASLLRGCFGVGVTFGAKYVIGHWALLVTPTAVYDLFHCLNIVWIVLFAWLFVGEQLNTRIEMLSCAGIVLGSIFAGVKSFDIDGDTSITALSLNVANGILAGVLVALLRRTMILMNELGATVEEVTCIKMLVGAVIVFPFAVLVEGPIAFQLSSLQYSWLWISSGVILLYHVNLSLLCLIAPAPVIGFIESLKPVPAFVITTGIGPKVPSTSPLFWLGSAIILASAMAFKISRMSFGRMMRPRTKVQESFTLSDRTQSSYLSESDDGSVTDFGTYGAIQTNAACRVHNEDICDFSFADASKEHPPVAFV